MTFTANVERWRSTVVSVLNKLFSDFPTRKSSVDAFKLTIAWLSDVVLAIIAHESSGDPNKYSDSENPNIHTDDSIGLMQLNYEAGTPQGVGYTGTPEGLLDPYTNIYYGTAYFLDKLIFYKGDLRNALNAYNAGRLITKNGIIVNDAYADVIIKILGKKNFTEWLLSLHSASVSGSTDAIAPVALNPVSAPPLAEVMDGRKYPLGGPVAIVCALGTSLALVFTLIHC